MTRGEVGDKNRKCSIDQTVLFNRSFRLAVAADEGLSFVGRHGPIRYSKDGTQPMTDIF